MTTPTQWTDELFEKMSSEYVARMEQFPEDERPSVSMEIVSEIAQENGVTPNGFRMKLTKAGVYIKKAAGSASKSSASTGEKASGGSRTSKAQAHADLRSAFSDAGLAPDFLDDTIIDKLTGKAAAHLAEAIRAITK
ncbi:DNA binding protein [Salmonella phage oldekolle]|uniref:Putative D3 protein n=1 Tax=Salmonella phage oldekolle TaxID=2713308 RepID=A0A6G8RD54_9CAUD|nr:DNA binding protein [Salmonella phage oldekolle]QIN99307.1 putative D3 protein [Salmonella phage oldekolle]